MMNGDTEGGTGMPPAGNGVTIDYNTNGGCATELCCGTAWDEEGTKLTMCGATTAATIDHTMRGADVTWSFDCGEMAAKLLATGISMLTTAYLL